MLFKKPHGATPEPDQAKIREFQERRAAKCNLDRAQPTVLCDAEMPSNWQPLSNNARYQQWMQRKWVAA